MKVYLVDGLRTSFCSLGGALKELSAPRLASPLMRALVQRQGLEPAEIDEVILGQVIQAGTGQAPARQAMRYAGLEDATPAMTINKVCGSGLKAIMLAADAIRLGQGQIFLAGGMESMSQAPYGLRNLRFGQTFGDTTAQDLLFWDALTDPYTSQPMGLLTEARISEKGIRREEQDDFARRSYEKAQAAQKAGHYEEEILPLTLRDKKGERLITEDEEPARARFEKISNLKPVFLPEGSITAANASSIDDGAAVLCVASERAVQQKGMRPLAEIVAYAQHSQAPDHFSLAPAGAMQKLLRQRGLRVNDIDLWEVNEAFAAVPLMAAREMRIPLERINLLGGAVALGHPVGASGARLALTLAKQLQRQKKRCGIASICIGGGEAVAMLLENAEF